MLLLHSSLHSSELFRVPIRSQWSSVKKQRNRTTDFAFEPVQGSPWTGGNRYRKCQHTLWFSYVPTNRRVGHNQVPQRERQYSTSRTTEATQSSSKHLRFRERKLQGVVQGHLLKAWSAAQQHKHHPGVCYQQNLQTYSRSSECNSHFNKVLMQCVYSIV